MWCSAGKSEIDTLLILQKPVLKKAYFLLLNILKIKDVFTLQIAKFIYKCLNLDIQGFRFGNQHFYLTVKCGLFLFV